MDHCETQKRKTNPRETANILSLVSFAYIVGLLKKGFKRDLIDDDLYEVIRRCNSGRCGQKLQNYWEKETRKVEDKGKSLSVTKILWKRWGKKYTFFAITNLTWCTLMSIIRPYALSNLIAYFSPGSTITKNEAYVYAFLMIFLHIADIFFAQNFVLWGQIFGTEIKTAFSSMLYRKALKLTPSALQEISLGNIVTLITKDVQTFRQSIWVMSDMLSAVCQVLTICVLLYIKLGPISLFGIGILFLSLPLQVYIGKWVARMKLVTCEKTDKRLQITQEILSTMKIIKIYTWETFFAEKINTARRLEIIKFLTLLFLRTLTVIVGTLFCKVGLYGLIAATIWAGVTTDTAVILYALSNFNDLRYWMGDAVPNSISQIGEFTSAYYRIVKALGAEELDSVRQQDQPTDKPLVELQEATVHIKDHEILHGLTFKITSGLTLVTGTVGSGKSSLFKAILKDYPLSSGALETRGRISYASQDPWLFPSSIKQNILFGEKYDETRYQEVIRVCALLFDFNLLENGDETIVTDRGLNLSKGQQARINLARAIYRDSEIYLLDDCLTALDAAVQDYIFEECIKKFLKDKICILITQTASHISEADNVIIIDEGTIKDIGKPDEKIIQEVMELAVEDDDLEKEVIVDKDEVEVNEKTDLIEAEQSTSKKKVYFETKKEGAVGFGVYKKYFMYGGGIIMVLINISTLGLAQFSTSYSDKLFTQWIDDKQAVMRLETNFSSSPTSNLSLNESFLDEAISAEDNTFKMYSLFLFVSTGLDLLKNYTLIQFCRRCSINIHNDIVKKITGAVMSFFDTHLIGNVLNRFSQDMVNVDEKLSFHLNQCYTTLFSIIGGLSLIISVNPFFTIHILLIITILLILRWMYLPASRSLKRLEASTRSPMIGHINATLEGLTTIRVCKVEDILIEEYDKHQDLYTSSYILSMTVHRGMGLFMSMISSTFMIAVIAKFLLFDSEASAGQVALALTQVFGVCSQIQWGIREWAELENTMTSFERLLEYTEIETEKMDGRVLENWPSEGAVTYEKVSLSYNNTDDTVLSNLNFEIKPHEKIGIVGRTGAGKSSIISTIFRLYEVQGKILIDGVDIKTLSLGFLRRSIAIIPQDPIIFSGTIRTNLDAKNEFSDGDLWEALEKVGMKNFVTSLDQIVSSTNVRFSSGQKQLISLARAILHRNKIVVMDEATANMDHETDAALHKIIKENFADATVLTIAHRLHSILECDKVIVLDRGEIREFNDPNALLDDKDGMFHKMVKQAGLLNYLS